MCTYDTFPGLRHGPEAVINERTMVVAFISKDGYLRKYEEDLLTELKEKNIGKAVLVCGSKIDGAVKKLSDYAVEFDPDDKLNITDDLTPPILVIIGQLLGMFKSLDLGFKPDTPSNEGIINRVVKGVKVYNPRAFRKSGTYSILSER
jgi:tagatose-6-phosphate ketose/aldose isomerase